MASRLDHAGQRSISASGISTEDQLALAKVLLRRLWRLLEHRFPAEADGLWDDMGCDAHALVDRAQEAACIIWERDRVYAEPCRRILDEQRRTSFRYLLIWPNGETRNVREDELIGLAGLPLEDDRAHAADDDGSNDVPY